MITLVTKPVGPAIDPEAVKRSLGIEHAADDAVILDLIEAATELIQDDCEIQLYTATAKLILDRFPSEAGGLIEIRRPPVTAIDSITYVDSDGASQTVSSWIADLDASPARLTPAYGASWPSTRPQIAAVDIRFQCGQTDVANVPAAAQRLITHLVALWFENRVPQGQAPQSDPYFRRQLDHLRWIW